MHLEMFSLSFRHEMTTEIDFSLFLRFGGLLCLPSSSSWHHFSLVFMTKLGEVLPLFSPSKIQRPSACGRSLTVVLKRSH